MLSLRFIVSAPQVLFAQQSHEVFLTTRGYSSKTTDAFSPSPVGDAPLGNTLVHNVEKMVNQNLVARSV